MSRPFDLVCVGHIVREMIHFPDRIEGPFLGSPPAYCSVAAARQGTVVGLVTKVGPDMPQDLLRPILEAGVDTLGVSTCARSTASELIYDLAGNKEIRYPTRADPIRAEDVPMAYHGCSMVYVCTMEDDVPLGELPAVARLGRWSAVDIGGYGGVHMSVAQRLATASLAELACEAARHFNIVKASDEDATVIFGEDRPVVSAQRLLACGPHVVLITLGAKGVLLCTAQGHWHVPPLPARVVDTTGGGDTFMAGFLSEYLRSADLTRAAQWGCATAACVIERGGGVRLERMPTRAHIQARVVKGCHQ